MGTNKWHDLTSAGEALSYTARTLDRMLALGNLTAAQAETTGRRFGALIRNQYKVGSKSFYGIDEETERWLNEWRNKNDCL